MSEGLPEGWAETDLSYVVAKLVDGSHNPPPKSETGLPMLSARNIAGGAIVFDDYRLIDCDRFEIEDARTRISAGDVLLTIVGALGRSAVVPKGVGPFTLQRSVAVISCREVMEPSFLERFFRSPAFQQWMQENAKGTAQRGVYLKMLGGAGVPLPPLPEQRRIVAKLDRLSARSAAVRRHLARVAALAARAKQAILAAAFNGDLTADWRSERDAKGEAFNCIFDAALEEVYDHADRRPKRRSSALADFGRVPAKLSLPPDWDKTTLENITSPTRLIQYGILMPGPDQAIGIPYVKVMNIRNGRIDLKALKRTTSAIHESYRRTELREGDILLTIRGTTGRVAFVPPELSGANITQDSVRIEVLSSLNSFYLFWYFQSPVAATYFDANQKGVAVRGINVGDLRPMEVPMCGRAEQDEIVRRIEAAFARIDRLADESTRAIRLLDRLDERLLAKAFRGELVPQDPADEPAATLLARLRQTRAAAPKRGRGRAGKGAA